MITVTLREIGCQILQNVDIAGTENRAYKSYGERGQNNALSQG